ncbi:putative Sensory subunit of low CO2-induced protein complex [Leifsonia rubra CMS 76R]|nr:putative Sensory subunit of low CO2-induced protein complex [Leifsonia rubra CMS 76R]
MDTLSGPGPFTVFAPTDAAFAKLPEGTVESLLADIPKLTAILTYHVVSGSVHAADLPGTPSATTVQGTDVTFDTSSGVKVNDATVTQADIATSNGVIHVIDTVLIPAS